MELKEFLRKWLKPTDEVATAEFEKDLNSIDFEIFDIKEYHDNEPEAHGHWRD